MGELRTSLLLARVLGLDDRDEPEQIVTLGALERGNVVHDTLEQFIREVMAEAGQGAFGAHSPWTDAHRARLRALADERFDALEAHGQTGRPVYWTQERAVLHEVLQRALDDDAALRAESGVVPAAVEWAFGEGGAPPLSLELPSGRTLQFRGRIDRVDRSPDGRAVVSDYKTGKGRKYDKLAEGDPVRAGTVLQLGLYAEAVRQAFGVDDVRTQYWILERPDNKPRFEGYAWDEGRRVRLLDVLDTIAEGIESGLFDRRPGRYDTFFRRHEGCAFCPFDRVCDRGRTEFAQAMADDPSFALLERLAVVDADTDEEDDA
ncbi:MAG: PD-(D/E)XK nuclease family protein [Ilumatobacteraceae bacterium]